MHTSARIQQQLNSGRGTTAPEKGPPTAAGQVARRPRVVRVGRVYIAGLSLQVLGEPHQSSGRSAGAEVEVDVGKKNYIKWPTALLQYVRDL